MFRVSPLIAKIMIVNIVYCAYYGLSIDNHTYFGCNHVKPITRI
jgi:hypothetical protein